MAFGDLKNDYLFHHIFGEHPSLAVALLNDLLDRQGNDRIAHLEMLPPEQRPPLAGAKLSILDLKARDQAGRTFVIEVQVLPMAGFINRVVFNACRAYDSQLQEGQSYSDLTPVIAVTLCDFLLWPDEAQDAAGQPRVPLVSKWRVTEKLGASNHLEQVQYAFVELPKVPEEGPLKTVAERWAWLFRQGSKLSTLPAQLTAEQHEAMELADRTRWSQAQQDAYRKALDEVQQARQLERDAEARGKAEGKEEGLREGKADGLREGKEEGLRAAISDLCELLQVELTTERRSHLAGLDLASLESLRVPLKQQRSWPAV
jgi:predicted transposase/invertase (TIGR01784 family)